MNKILSWHDVLAEEKKKPYFIEILMLVARYRASGITIYPPKQDIFNAFILTELHNIKVVILGQDPYHGQNQAHGLAFSVMPGVKVPPSLLNIYKELKNDIVGFKQPDHGFLGSWAKQGVMLLNTVLTVEAGKARSHANLGWETFTDRIIKIINEKRQNIIFLLWGSLAQKKGKIIDIKRHFVLKAPHPSPLSVHHGFFGCRHFSRTNEILINLNKLPIDWIPRLYH